MTTRARSFFSFSSLRWWAHQPIVVTWRQLADLTLLELDARGEFVPRRSEKPGSTASFVSVRVRIEDC